MLAIQAPSRCFGDPAMGKKSSRNPTSVGSASKLPSQLRIRRTSPHAAAVRSRPSARDLQRRAECSRRTNARYASNASHSTLAARATRSHLTHPQVLVALQPPHCSRSRRPLLLCRGQSPPHAGKRKVRCPLTALMFDPQISPQTLPAGSLWFGRRRSSGGSRPASSSSFAL